MKVAVPNFFRAEREELHDELAAAAKLYGSVGQAARTAAQLLQSHFLKEEAFALPPLGLLPALARGEVMQGMLPIVSMADRLKREMPVMMAERQAIIAVLRELERAALARRDDVRVRLANKIVSHMQAEEELLCPAAVLVGEYVKLKLQVG